MTSQISPQPETLTPATSVQAIQTTRPILRYWPAMVIVVVILLLAGLYKFTISQFQTQVIADHAQHGQTSPHVHEIVHLRQKLLIGIDPHHPPFAFKQNHELVGFDIDLGKAIARELNVPVEFIEHDFDSSLSAHGLGDSNPLTENQVDLVLSGVSINRLRAQYYAFSKPYLTAGLVAISKKSNTAINQDADLAGKSLGVIEHQPAVDLAQSVTSTHLISTYSSTADAIEALEKDQIQALIAEAPVARVLVANQPAIHIATDLLTQDEYAVMTARDEDDLIGEINSILTILRQKGVLESLRHKWLE